MRFPASWLMGTTILAACSGGPTRAISPHGFAGVELPVPLNKPALQFVDAQGAPFRFDSATAGKVTLVMFGYTHCPDICPVHLANIAAVLDRMPEEVQRQVRVVFITVDPARDTGSVLRSWVHGFDPEFIGLAGSDSVLRRAQLMLQVPVATAARVDARLADTGYAVGHAAQVIAFTRDGKGRVAYPPGTRQREWAHDLPLLVGFDPAQ